MRRSPEELTEAQRGLIESHAYLVAELVSRFGPRYRGVLDTDDTRQIAWYGIVLAAQKYRPEVGEFAAYAWATAAGQLQHAARWAAKVRLHDAASLYFVGYSRESSVLDGDEAAQAELGRVARRAAVSMLLGFGGRTVAGLSGEPAASDEPLCEGWAEVRAAVASLADDERTLIERIYFQGDDVVALSSELGVGRHALRRRHHAALDQLRDILAGAG